MGSSSKYHENQLTMQKQQDKQCFERFSSRQEERWSHRSKVPIHTACPFGHRESRRSIEYLYSLTKFTSQQKLECATKNLGRHSQLRYPNQVVES